MHNILLQACRKMDKEGFILEQESELQYILAHSDKHVIVYESVELIRKKVIALGDDLTQRLILCIR
jgi:hypothetical protein